MGEPAARIVEQDESLRSRGIIIGARGLAPAETLPLGSVALQVIQAGRGSVLVVRKPTTAKE